MSNRSCATISFERLLEEIPNVIEFGCGIYVDANVRNNQPRLMFHLKYPVVVGYSNKQTALYGITVVVSCINSQIITVYFENAVNLHKENGKTQFVNCLVNNDSALQYKCGFSYKCTEILPYSELLKNYKTF